MEGENADTVVEGKKIRSEMKRRAKGERVREISKVYLLSVSV